jgi:very-short-patch-repair endonuclease
MSKFYIGKARALRRNMTEAERTLWRRLRNKGLGVKFRRQEPIGGYIVDFVCYEKRIVIELDGGQHIVSLEDVKRDNWLKERGFKVLRFWSNDVLRNIDGVIREIEVEINKVK